MLKVGQKVEVKVLGVDVDRKRISLSMKELEADPWDLIFEQYSEGQLVEATITKLTKFGAFASLAGSESYDIEGLIHISELSDRRIEHPREVVQEGQIVALRILKIDRRRRRIALSLKRVDSPAYADQDWQVAMQEIESLAEEGINILAAEGGDIPDEEAPEEAALEAASDASPPEDEVEKAASGDEAEPSAEESVAVSDEPDKLESELDEPEAEIEVPESEDETPEAETDEPEAEIEVPEAEDEAPETETDEPEAEIEAPEAEEEEPEAELETLETESGDTEVEEEKAPSEPELAVDQDPEAEEEDKGGGGETEE
jgi:predicted RNA-binding protein with RPS1 domain